MKTFEEFKQDVVTPKSLLLSFISANVVTFICSAFVSNAVGLLILLQVLLVGFLVIYSKALNFFAKVLAAIIMLVILVTLFVCNKNKDNEPEEYADIPTQQQDVQQDPQEEQPQLEEEKQEDNQAENQTTAVAKTYTTKSSYTRRNYGTSPQNVTDKITSVSYGGGTTTHNSMSSGIVAPTVGGNTTDFTGQATQPSDPIDTTGKDVTEENEGVDSVTDTATDEEKNDVNNNNGATDGNWEEMLPPKDETITDEKPNEDNNSDNNTQTPPVEDDNTQTDGTDTGNKEDQKDETTTQKPVEKPTDTPSKEEDSKDETPVKDETPKEDVKISSMVGSTAYAGDTIQFKITGDVKNIEGLDGLSYTFKNGVLTINTAKDEATVITPKVIGENGSTATTTVTVSVLNFNK